MFLQYKGSWAWRNPPPENFQLYCTPKAVSPACGIAVELQAHERDLTCVFASVVVAICKVCFKLKSQMYL